LATSEGKTISTNISHQHSFKQCLKPDEVKTDLDELHFTEASWNGAAWDNMFSQCTIGVRVGIEGACLERL
jgi:hypothetical protein